MIMEKTIRVRKHQKIIYQTTKNQKKSFIRIMNMKKRNSNLSQSGKNEIIKIQLQCSNIDEKDEDEGNKSPEIRAKRFKQASKFKKSKLESSMHEKEGNISKQVNSVSDLPQFTHNEEGKLDSFRFNKSQKFNKSPEVSFTDTLDCEPRYNSSSINILSSPDKKKSSFINKIKGKPTTKVPSEASNSKHRTKSIRSHRKSTIDYGNISTLISKATLRISEVENRLVNTEDLLTALNDKISNGIPKEFNSLHLRINKGFEVFQSKIKGNHDSGLKSLNKYKTKMADKTQELLQKIDKNHDLVLKRFSKERYPESTVSLK